MRQGLRVVGIAVMIRIARAFADDLGLDYPILSARCPARARPCWSAGVSATPRHAAFSVLIDAAGIVRWTHLGAVRREQLETQLAELR
jgi:hypothetical protein